MEEQGHCEHLWELSDENGFCFIVEYLNVEVTRNFRDADTSYQELMSGEAAKERVTLVPSKS